MIIQKIENQIIKDQYSHAQHQMMTPANLGIIKSGRKEDLLTILDNVKLNRLYQIRTRSEFDNWFDRILQNFHEDLFVIYRENLTIEANNPYSYSARFLNQYLRKLYCNTWLYRHRGERYIQVLHPVLSNKFLNIFPNLNKSKVNQIENREDYYEIIEFYRELIDEHLSQRNNPLLKLKMGEDY